MSAQKSDTITATATEFSNYSCPPLADIKTYVPDLNEDSTNYTDAQNTNASEVDGDYSNTETSPADGEDWADFVNRKKIAALQTTLYGSINIYDVAQVNTVSVNYLYAGENYQICGYLEDVTDVSSAGEYASFQTAASDVNYTWSITTSGTTQTATTAKQVCDIVSYAQGVNPQRNVDCKRTDTQSSRRLQAQPITYTAVYEAVIAADKTISSPTTQDLANLDAVSLEFVKDEVTAIIPTGWTYTPYTTAAYSAAQPNVSFTTAPAITAENIGENSVTVTFAVDNNEGEVACIVVP